MCLKFNGKQFALLLLSALLVGRTVVDLHDMCAETWRALGISLGMRNTDRKVEEELKEISLFLKTRTFRLI